MSGLALAAAALALVAEDGAALRSAPSDTAPAQVVLYRGDWVEVRGEAPGFLKVWDHRRERGGYLRPASVRVHRLVDGPAAASELAALVRFLREAGGFESLGIGYAALYLKAAPAERRALPEWAEVLAALGEMAERLARRASGGAGGAGGAWSGGPAGAAGARPGDLVLAGQVGVAEGYGVVFRRFERGGRLVVCYDGDAFARVLQLPDAPADTRARAALALTRRGCLDPATAVAQRRAWNQARLDVLAGLDRALGSGAVPRLLAYRLHLRAAEALADRAHAEAAQAHPAPAASAASDSLRRLALVDRGGLAPEDLPAYEEAALRVAAIRWLAEPPPTRARPLAVEIVAARPGETCVRLRPTAAPAGSSPLLERCTYGVVMPASLRFAPSARTMTLAVAPVPGWTELWVFRSHGATSSWGLDVLAPGAGEPGQDVGYVELAGFSPDGKRLLIARELRAGTRLTRRFEQLAPDSAAVEHWSSIPDRLVAFRRWTSPTWRQSTLALR